METSLPVEGDVADDEVSALAPVGRLTSQGVNPAQDLNRAGIDEDGYLELETCHHRDMEWGQVLVALVSGGLGGTILGRVWDNRREDRFRHTERKREVAADFVRLILDIHGILWEGREEPDRAMQEAALKHDELNMCLQEVHILFATVEARMYADRAYTRLLRLVSSDPIPGLGHFVDELQLDSFRDTVRAELGVHSRTGVTGLILDTPVWLMSLVTRRPRADIKRVQDLIKPYI